MNSKELLLYIYEVQSKAYILISCIYIDNLLFNSIASYAYIHVNSYILQ